MTRAPAPDAFLAEIPGVDTATWSKLPSLTRGAWLLSRSGGPDLVVRPASDVEVTAARAAGLARVGAPVVAASQGWMAVEFLVGERVSSPELSRPQMLADLGRLLRHWHAADVVLPESSLAAARATYLAAVPDERLPAGMTSAAADADLIEAELLPTFDQRRPAHLDVVANLIATGDGLRLIDFEYAASADPVRELGQVVWEGELDRVAAGRLVRAYEPTGGGAVAATAAWAWIVGVTWTLWACANEDRWALHQYARRSWERVQTHWAAPSV
jgi:hypothetical protein